MIELSKSKETARIFEIRKTSGSKCRKYFRPHTYSRVSNIIIGNSLKKVVKIGYIIIQNTSTLLHGLNPFGPAWTESFQQYKIKTNF